MMDYLLIADIYGKTPHLASFARELPGKTMICDPYHGQLQAVNHEPLQYSIFMAECGHEVYQAKVEQLFSLISEPTVVIAFSAGASAAWRAQSVIFNNNIKRIIAFYPSQVRYSLELDARVPCEFIFPHSELHFDIQPIIRVLKKKALVNCIETQYGHGFMNPLSTQFDMTAYHYFTRQITKKLNFISDKETET